MNWRVLECQTINPCICNSFYRHLFLINHYSLFCLFVSIYLEVDSAIVGDVGLLFFMPIFALFNFYSFLLVFFLSLFVLSYSYCSLGTSVSGRHSCMSCEFSVAALNRTCFLYLVISEKFYLTSAVELLLKKLKLNVL